MHTARDTRVAIGTVISILLITLSFPLLHAHADSTSLDPSSCNTLYGLPAGTISTAASAQYLNPTTCAAMIDLISRYNPGPASQIGLSHAKVTGITSLNTTFAVNLDNMLKAADAAGYHITINSAYRTIAGEVAANAKGFSGNPSASMHTKGLAADLQYPNDGNVTGECDGNASNLSAAYKWVFANDSTYHLGQYDQLHAHATGECNHVEAVAGSTPGGLGPGGGSAALAGASTATQQQSGQTPITSTPGLGSSPTAGQTVSQDTNCILSTNPLYYVTIPAGSAYPSNCLMQTNCPTGYSMASNGTCSQQSCPAGYNLVNGMCNLPQSTQPAASSAATPASAASTPAASTATTAAQPTLASPTLVSNLTGTSSTGITTIPQITTTSATETASLPNGPVSQLQAPAIPGVTYAQPTSGLFPAGTQQAANSNTTPANSGNSITTTAGTGYDIPADGSGNAAVSGSVSGTIASTQTPNGVDTFGSTASMPTASGQLTVAPSTNPSGGTLSLLATLKAQVLGAISFLSAYISTHLNPAPAPIFQGGE